MPNESSVRRAKRTSDTQQTSETTNREPTKRELQRQMQRTRESLAETIGEIKDTVEHEYVAAKETVSGVLDYREQFKEEPLVWSLGALSAGFALGYTLGYAHKNTKGGKQEGSGKTKSSESECEEIRPKEKLALTRSDPQISQIAQIHKKGLKAFALRGGGEWERRSAKSHSYLCDRRNLLI